ncbi:MAG: beta-glucosidase family protein [Acidobacteria bacterium]|nr:beta-glucosidase family protein [Acidobacteriota bacterium]
MNEFERDAGQVLLAGFDQSAYDADLERLLTEVHPAGAIFYRPNISGIDEFSELVQQVTSTLGDRAGLPILALDMEGGSVDRLRHLLAPLPSSRAVAATDDDPFMRQFGALIGEAMAALRLNLDFAPVLDLAAPESEPVMGSRAVSRDPATVVRFARNFVAGLNRFSVLGCGKHFPGLGSGARDTHQEMAPIETPAEQLWERDLLPFRELHDELLLMMVNHAWYPALHPPDTPPRPASLSRTVVTELLREKVGFGGVVVADDLQMGAVLAARSVGEAAVAAIEAGCDLLPICRQADLIRAAHRALVERAGADPGFADRLHQAAGRIEVLQQSLRTLAAGAPQRRPDWDGLRERIRAMAEQAEGLGQVAAERPRYSAAAAAARPRKPERGDRPPRGTGDGRSRSRDRGRPPRDDRRRPRETAADRDGNRRRPGRPTRHPRE